MTRPGADSTDAAIAGPAFPAAMAIMVRANRMVTRITACIGTGVALMKLDMPADPDGCKNMAMRRSEHGRAIAGRMRTVTRVPSR